MSTRSNTNSVFMVTLQNITTANNTNQPTKIVDFIGQKYCAKRIRYVCWTALGLLDPVLSLWSILFPLTSTQNRIFSVSIIPLLTVFFQSFTVRISAAVNICTGAKVSLEKTCRSIIAESQGMHILHFNRSCQIAFKVAVPINTPTNSVCKSGFPTLLPTLKSTSIFGIWILCEALTTLWGWRGSKAEYKLQKTWCHSSKDKLLILSRES